MVRSGDTCPQYVLQDKAVTEIQIQPTHSTLHTHTIQIQPTHSTQIPPTHSTLNTHTIKIQPTHSTLHTQHKWGL